MTKFDNPYWTDVMRINYQQRKIAVLSIIYYEMNDSVVSDKEFDKECRQLVELQKNREAFEKSMYRGAFEGFDGTTGFDLYEKLSKADKVYLRKIADRTLMCYRKDNVKC